MLGDFPFVFGGRLALETMIYATSQAETAALGVVDENDTLLVK
jgi:hypothetical protein